MPQSMFQDLVVSRPGVPQGRRGIALPLSIVLHGSAFALAIGLPLLLSADMPVANVHEPPMISFEIARIPVANRPAPAAARPRPPAASRPEHVMPPPAVVPPDVVPETTGASPSDPETDLPIGSGCESCGPGVGDGPDEGPGVSDGPPASAPAPPVRPGIGGVKAPTKVKNVAPEYPLLARHAGVAATVTLECTIDEQGVVRDLRVVHGHPLLDAAAIDAVRQWRYTPTLLSGHPVSVIMTVTVNFTLSR